MYLANILLENSGPITSLDVSMPFNADDSPKPLVVVGTNGSGKTIFLSHIADALVEFAKTAFRDVVGNQNTHYNPYLRLVSPRNHTSGASYGLALLEFRSPGKSFGFAEKTGTLDPQAISSKLAGRFSAVANWPKDGNHKSHQPEDKEVFEAFFVNSSVCYFPTTRRELPHWLNRGVIPDAPSYGEDERLAGILAKPIIVESSWANNKQWLLDVVLDSRPDFDVINGQPTLVGNWQVAAQLVTSRKNVEALLGTVLRNDKVRLSVEYRGRGRRLSVAIDGRTLIPSIEHLSSGQSMLFNMFLTIIRYSDRADVNKSINLANIEGIVLVDEIDAHLHSELQYEVLPALLKLFPKVQFIVTSHSPLFLLGIENTFGQDGVHILALPGGHRISSERFSEFRRSYAYVTETTTFEADVKAKAQSFQKPVLITEGRSDAQIIATAWSKLHANKPIPFDLIPSGIEANEDKRCGNADSVRRMLEFLPSVTNQSVVGLFDNDREGNEQFKGLNERAFERWEPGCARRKHLSRNLWGLLLPVPTGRRLFVTEDNICQRYLAIEHYFTDEVLSEQSMKGASILGSPVFEIQGNKKMKFANSVASLDPAAFSEFAVLFKCIADIMGLPGEECELADNPKELEPQSSLGAPRVEVPPE